MFLDPQFIPWNIYSDKQMSKLGDRMNIPKNLKNREEYIEEKARKVAVQNNTGC